MKIQGMLAQTKTDSALNEWYIPDLKDIYNEETRTEDKISIGIKHFTAEAYHAAISRGGVYRPVEIFVKQVFEIRNLELSDGTEITTADELMRIAKSPIANLIIQLTVEHLFKTAQTTDEERKN